MQPAGTRFLSTCLVLLGSLRAGSAAVPPEEAGPPPAPTFQTIQATGIATDARAVRSPQVPPPPLGAVPPPAHAPGFEGMAEVRIEALIHEVLTRNPSLAQMTAAWQAA